MIVGGAVDFVYHKYDGPFLGCYPEHKHPKQVVEPYLFCLFLGELLKHLGDGVRNRETYENACVEDDLGERLRECAACGKFSSADFLEIKDDDDIVRRKSPV